MIEEWKKDMNCKPERKMQTLYEEENYTLQRLFIKIGDCKMIKYREIRNLGKCGLDVKEVKEPPLWYLRELQLRRLGI